MADSVCYFNRGLAVLCIWLSLLVPAVYQVVIALNVMHPLPIPEYSPGSTWYCNSGLNVLFRRPLIISLVKVDLNSCPFPANEQLCFCACHACESRGLLKIITVWLLWAISTCCRKTVDFLRSVRWMIRCAVSAIDPIADVYCGCTTAVDWNNIQLPSTRIVRYVIWLLLILYYERFAVL